MHLRQRLGYASVLVSVFVVSCAVSLLGAYAISAKQAPDEALLVPVTTTTTGTAPLQQVVTMSATSSVEQNSQLAAPGRALPPTTDALAPPLSTAPVATTPPSTQPNTTTPLYVVGDSLTVGARSATEEGARGIGLSLTLDAVSGRSTRTGLEVLANLAPPAGSVVVMALGTNDSNSYAKYAEYIDKTMSLVPTARRVIWLTVWRKGPLNEINRAIHDAVLRYPNFAVVDWVETLRSHPEFLDADNTHYSSAGYKLRAKAVLTAALS